MPIWIAHKMHKMFTKGTHNQHLLIVCVCVSSFYLLLCIMCPNQIEFPFLSIANETIHKSMQDNNKKNSRMNVNSKSFAWCNSLCFEIASLNVSRLSCKHTCYQLSIAYYENWIDIVRHTILLIYWNWCPLTKSSQPAISFESLMVAFHSEHLESPISCSLFFLLSNSLTLTNRLFLHGKSLCAILKFFELDYSRTLVESVCQVAWSMPICTQLK